MFIDYYKVLGIDKKATPKEIKSAYRKMARKLHPDLNPNDKDAKRQFQEINEANEVLSDPEKRSKYDQFGKDWQHAGAPQQQGQYRERPQSSGRQGFSGTQYEGDFSDFFESLFGGTGGSGRGRQAKYRGEDYSASLQLELKDVLETRKQTLTVNGHKIRITIPAGIENGQTIKVAGYGGQGVNGGPNADLYITFSIADHPGFKRMGNDLYAKADLNLYTAILGGEITIETLDGKVKMKVAPETRNGTKVKLKGKGLPVYKNDGRSGDLYVTYTILIPTKLNERQKSLFTELSKIQS